ncbi:MAG TPA: 4-deoxy-4-formamido-L-arabinose-phosphoundecaprenol deformylase [Deltaproteobacteria bacterium]|nr:4-deoxy-4-formamido-L-arabinose-phosphoundecaprenol deformylase [Deltaproteobacteria bacterium]
MRAGLRVDVDTYRGTKQGVPRLCRLLSQHGVKASFFFSVGPDNMGRHLFRLLRPQFLGKMLRTKASNLYGWDILIRGTLWPGPMIGKRLGNVIRATRDEGHEIGLHAWDHHGWQAGMDDMDGRTVSNSLQRGIKTLTAITGRAPSCSAVPGWKCNDLVLEEKGSLAFAYNSDCRGDSIFYPVVDGKTIPQPQIPVTLPTYDELIGRNQVSNRNYNQVLLDLFRPNQLNVLTIHAEVEGMACFDLFGRFLEEARLKGIEFVPLGKLLEDPIEIDQASIVPKTFPGREGWIACQEGAVFYVGNSERFNV